MKTTIFSGAAHVEMQGKEVLQFLSVEETYAHYELLGFKDHPVSVIDYRAGGLTAIQGVIETGDDSQFPKDFNFPSHISIIQLSTSNLLIELKDTLDANPDYMLWIAIGFSDSIPNYEYVFQDQECLDGDRSIALLSLYKRPRVYTVKTQPLYYSFSNR